MRQDLSLVCLMRDAKGARTPPLLILLHGVGGDEHGWDDILPLLDERFLVLSARAPNVYANGGYCWFNVAFQNGKFSIDATQAQSSWRAISNFADEAAAAYNVPAEQVYLMGFSQGAAMAFCTMLTAPEKLGGIIALNGRLVPEVRSFAVSAERLQGFPVLYVYGTHDNVIPVSFAHESREYLKTSGVALDAHEYPIAHQITVESLRDANRWLAQRLEKGNLL